jgi:hypothetical protein
LGESSRDGEAICHPEDEMGTNWVMGALQEVDVSAVTRDSDKQIPASRYHMSIDASCIVPSELQIVFSSTILYWPKGVV